MLKNWPDQPLNLKRNVSAQSNGFQFGINAAIPFFKSLDGKEAPNVPGPLIGRKFMRSGPSEIVDLLYACAIGDGVPAVFIQPDVLRNIFAGDGGGNKRRFFGEHQ